MPLWGGGSGGGGGGSGVGAEVAYAEVTAGVTLPDSAAVTDLVTAGAFTADGTSAYLIEFYCPLVANFGGETRIVLREGATELGLLEQRINASQQSSAYVARRLTPTAGSHTYKIAAYRYAGTGQPIFAAGAGGADATALPMFIRITKVT